MDGSGFDVDAVAAAHSSRKEKDELWGFTDMAKEGIAKTEINEFCE